MLYCCSVLLEMLILSPRNITLPKYTLNLAFETDQNINFRFFVLLATKKCQIYKETSSSKNEKLLLQSK